MAKTTTSNFNTEPEHLCLDEPDQTETEFVSNCMCIADLLELKSPSKAIVDKLIEYANRIL